MSRFELSEIAFLTSLTDHKYSPDGKTKVISNSFKAEKGKVFIVAILGVEEPKDVTPELVKSRLRAFADADWEKTRHGQS